MQAQTPATIGQYEILHRLARGGMGEIFLARQKGIASFERLAILKTLIEDSGVQDEKLDQFFDEARLVATLNHPNIISVLEVGRQAGTYFIAMEFIRGVNLVELIRLLRQQRRFLPPRVGAAIIRQAALGLDYAHRAVDVHGAPMQLVHRDVSPHNIMVRLDGVVKVVDFGVARAANRLAQTRNNLLKGKLSYLAPEQIRGEAATALSDQFSLGVVMWELFSLQKLFRGDSVFDTARLIASTPVAPLVVMVPDCPSAVDEVAQVMLQRQPEDRYKQCADAASALQAFLDGSGGNPDDEVAAFVEEIAGELVRRRVALPETSLPGASLRVDAEVTASAAQTLCPRCSKVLDAGDKFCDGCGAPLSDDMPGIGPSAVTSGEYDLDEDFREIELAPPVAESAGLAPAAVEGLGDAPPDAAPEPPERDGGQVAFADLSEDAELELELDLVEGGSGRLQAPFELHGRAAALTQLSDLLERAKQGQTEALLMLGAEGVGKSRMLDEAERMAAQAGFSVAFARGASHDVPVAFDLFRQWILALSNALSTAPRGIDRLPNFSVGEMVARITKARIPGPVARRLAQIFDGQLAEVFVDAEQHYARMTGAMVQFLWVAAQASPLCLIVDDAHLADPASVELLASLLRRLPHAPIAVLVTCGVDAEADFSRGWQRMELSPIDDEASRSLVRQRLGGATAPAALLQLLARGARGNPLLILQQCDLLIERQRLLRSGGGWQLGAVEEGLLLRTVSDLLRCRQEALSKGALLVLRMAALAGEVFSTSLLEVACFGRGIDVRQALSEAAVRGMVVPLARSRTSWYFGQSCLRRGLISEMAVAEQGALRLVIANGYDRAEVVPRGLALEVITRHLLASGNAEAAGPYATAVGQRLMAQGAPKQAAELMRLGLGLELRQTISSGQVSPGVSAHLFRVAESAARCLLSVDPGHVADMVHALQQQLPPHHAHAERALAVSQRARALLSLNRFREAQVTLDGALQAMPRDADPVARATLQAEWGVVLASAGETDKAIAQIEGAMRAMVDALADWSKAPPERLAYLSRMYCRLGRLYARRLRFKHAAQALDRARELSRRADQPLLEMRAVMQMADQARKRGEHEAGLAALKTAQEIAEQMADPWSLTYIFLERGEALMASDGAKGASLLKKARFNARLSAQWDVERRVLAGRDSAAP